MLFLTFLAAIHRASMFCTNINFRMTRERKMIVFTISALFSLTRVVEFEYKISRRRDELSDNFIRAFSI